MECLKLNRGSSDSQQTYGFCPLDRTVLDATNIHELFPAPLLISNLVDELEVYCLNEERDCLWTGRRWELAKHLLLDCEYTGVPCGGTREAEEGGDASRKCELMVQRRFQKDEKCAHEIFACTECLGPVTSVSVDDHLEYECEMNYTKCELCQNDVIPKKNLEKHMSNCTKSTHYVCPARLIGCTWTGTSETSMESHVDREKCPLNQLLPVVENLDLKIETVTKENKYLQSQLHHVLNNVHQGKITNLGYSEPLEEVGTCSARSRQDDYLHLRYEMERLKFELEESVSPFISRERNLSSERQSLLNGLANDNYLMKEDLNLQRALISSLRKQVSFLLFRNRMGPGMSAGQVGEIDLGPEVGGMLSGSRSSSEERPNLKL